MNVISTTVTNKVDKNAIRIQFASDLHLETHRKNTPFQKFIKLTPESKNTNLVLAGDIVSFNCKRTLPFFEWCSKHFKKVFWISGNHEYYMRGKYTIEDCLEWKRDICEESGENVIPLDNEVIHLRDDIVLIGATMWTDIPLEIAEDVESKINDYRQIKDFNVPYQNQLHQTARKFLSNSLEKYKYLTKIVVTHHAPVKNKTVAERWRGALLNPVFTVDVEDLVIKSDYWIFGHTHFSTEFKIGKCLVMSNCKGYGSGHSLDKKFSVEKVFIV